MRPRVLRWLAVTAATTLLSGAMLAADGGPHTVAVGFSFSPYAATTRGLSPDAALTSLLTTLSPDVVRLPVYWSDVSARQGVIDFTQIDDLLAVVRQHNDGATAPARVILTVGVRNFGYPEVWAPSWLNSPTASAADLEGTTAYSAYLRATVSQFASEPLLVAWQVENEPFDNVSAGRAADVDLADDVVENEIAEVKSIDKRHAVVVTTFDSATVDLDELAITSPAAAAAPGEPQPAGEPEPALESGADVLGLDAYVVTPNTSLSDVPATERIDWKSNELAFWSQRAQSRGKSLWVTEMQAEPDTDTEPFVPGDLLYSAQAYRNVGVSLVMLWGVESWLLSPEWMTAGLAAIGTLRGTGQQA